MRYAPRRLVTAWSIVPTMATRASAIGAPEAASVTVPCTLAGCCAARGAADNARASATPAPGPILPRVSRMVCFLTDEVSNNDPAAGRRAGSRASNERAGLATTSAGDDDVALEVGNAANGNLLHVASSCLMGIGGRCI